MKYERYDIPSSIDELFENGERNYSIIDEESELDNIQSMQLFIECVGIPDENIVLNDGTQITLRHDNYEYNLVVDAGGLGDFHSHGFEISIEE